MKHASHTSKTEAELSMKKLSMPITAMTKKLKNHAPASAAARAAKEKAP